MGYRQLSLLNEMISVSKFLACWTHIHNVRVNFSSIYGLKIFLKVFLTMCRPVCLCVSMYT